MPSSGTWNRLFETSLLPLFWLAPSERATLIHHPPR